ncbi:hypothetical protein DERF_006424 [Dermatophagoides farinae]|uniref:Uncharacterized protein n=1 Tax=Dermatophagoides farinae TaxID=6954 RepID=A0A922I8Z1_DERFA|nr:hypothetical protein DERF_006424 [Dermatophagoides farinae]
MSAAKPTSFANGSSGFGAESNACIDNNTVRICKAGLHLSNQISMNQSINLQKTLLIMTSNQTFKNI